MVKEIECPYCHSVVVPRHRFSSLTFATLLFLGFLPFILSIIACAIVWNVLLPTLRLLRSLPTGVLPSTIPPEILNLFMALPTSMGLISFASLILSLVIGITPAIIYWAFRHDTYKCPTCKMSI